MVQLWITCLSQTISEFTCHVPRTPTKRSGWSPHLLSSPPPLARRLRLFHLDQDVLLGVDVNHAPSERPAHLQLQQSVVTKVCQVHRCETADGQEKTQDPRWVEVIVMEDEGYRKCPWRRQPASSRGCLDLDTYWRRAETQSCSLLTHSVSFVSPSYLLHITLLHSSKMLILLAKPLAKCHFKGVFDG